MAGNYYDKIAGIYDASRYLTPEVADLAAAFFVTEAGLSSSSTLVEVGIGTATNVLPLAPTGIKIIGTEQSQGMLEQANKRLALANADYDLFENDTLPLPFEDATADAVLTVHVVHAFADWRGLLKEIGRVRKPGGVYFYAEYLLPPHRREFENLYRAALADVSPPRPGKPPRPQVPTLSSVWTELEQHGENPQKRTLATWPVTETVSQLLGWYEARAFGSCWGMPEPTLHQGLALLRARLTERYGSLEHHLSSEAAYDVLWARRS